MSTAVVLLNFGEPEDATLEAVVPFLQRLFDLNRGLETHATADASRARDRALAEARAPGLIAEYLTIGGSPLHTQARTQADALEAVLRARGCDAFALLGMQFTEPSIDSAVEAALARGATRIVGLPVYPLCGPTTTVAALASLRDAATRIAPEIDVWEVAGWHRHPAYVALRAQALLATAERAGISLDDPGTRLVFSAHGTPLKYIDEGSRYIDYVQSSCALVAEAAGVRTFSLGYQNHSNRPLEWTQPDVSAVIDGLPAEGVKHVVVDAISFMHEQSETLAELDHELRARAEGNELGFHRVPVPFDHPSFIAALADLVGPFTRPGSPDETRAAAAATMRHCVCRPTSCTFCLNGDRT